MSYISEDFITVYWGTKDTPFCVEGLLTGYLIVLTFSSFVLNSQILYLTQMYIFSNRQKLYYIKYILF